MNIKVNSLSKIYGNRKVLDIDALEIKRGTLCGILGPNGAGKSTLVKILSGLEVQTNGDIYYEDYEKNYIPYKNITMVFQKPYLLRTSVYNNVAYPMKIRNYDKDKIEKRSKELLEELGLEELRDQKAWKLSGGETQKVALARALSFNPEVLLLDEPTSNIDTLSVATIEKIIKKINKKDKTTVIIITHNIQQAKRICSDIIFMNKGKIIEKGKVDEVLNNPANQLTKAFIEGELLI